METLNSGRWRRATVLGLLMALLALSLVVSSGAARADDGEGEGDDVTYHEHAGRGARNVVMVSNHKDDRVLMRGSVELDRDPGDIADPLNMAQAYASCTDCTTYAVALQIALISRSAHTITPQNYAVALNIHCTRCVTVARALQYVVQVDDPRDMPRDVADLINAMDRELRNIAKDARSGTITVEQADTRVTAIIDQFKTLALSLYDQRQVSTNEN